MKKVETVVAVHVGEPGDQKKLTEERKHGGNLEIDGGLLSILPHLPKNSSPNVQGTRYLYILKRPVRSAKYQVETCSSLLRTRLRFDTQIKSGCY